MGSSSRSSQTQHTSNQNTQVSWADNSEHYTDNSDNSSFDYWQDNSDNSSTDISLTNEGWGAGANIGGDVTIVDGGAITAMKETAMESIKQATEQTYLATEFGKSAVASNERVSRDAMVTAENTAKHAIYGMQDTVTDSLAAMLKTSQEAITGAADQTNVIASTSEANTAKAIEASNKAMERNAALIQTTALGGQDLMIDMLKKVLIGTAVALTVGAVTVAISGRKKAA